ncbi:UNVERIFIED_CONTAM: protein VASCULAR ASSOCIATED DEATH 1, chloroplastic [Sesamum calycinum]|uniref:Protein VASCULAR ASSOCIATED DEATH 1, chloroplastic n=1 Tax=Sesamum calycinum TaxID=2727403 RepID=A0AAW2SZS0_9LAMI
MAAVVSEQMVDPAPTSAPPAAQSMDNHNSSRRFSGDSPEALDPSLTSSAPSPSTQLDSQTQSPSRVEEYRQLFRLPPDEGHMYLFVHYICFYSNLFGFETKYFFTSFLFRDEAFKLISEGWLQHGNGSKEITEQQEPKSDASSQECDSSIVEESGSSKQYVDDSDVIKSDQNGPILEESKHVGEGEPEIISTSSVMEVREQANAEVPLTVECSSSEKSSVWKPEDNDAPGVPEGYTKVAESKFPSSSVLHGILMKNLGTPVMYHFNIQLNSILVQDLGAVKSHLIVDTSQEINDVPYGDYFTVEARWDVENDGNDSKPGCILRVYINVAFSKKTMWKGKIVQSTLEECREAYAIWIDLAHEVLKQKNLEKEEGGRSSNMISNDQVQRKKLASTQQFVESKTIDVGISQITPEVKDMNQRVHAPPQGNVSEASVGSLFKETFAKICDIFQTSELFIPIYGHHHCYNSSSDAVFISYFVTSKKHCHLNCLQPQGKRKSHTELCRCLLYHVFHHMYPRSDIAFSILPLLLLTLSGVNYALQENSHKMSILVLLSRPQRIHVIPQADCMSSVRGLTENRGEALASLNKQIKYLKEEMHFVETMLEKLQNEHTQQGKDFSSEESDRSAVYMEHPPILW